MSWRGTRLPKSCIRPGVQRVSITYIMRLLLSCVLFLFSGVAYGLSSSGNRLLVVIEEATEQVKYSKFWIDLKGTSCTIVNSSMVGTRAEIYPI